MPSLGRRPQRRPVVEWYLKKVYQMHESAVLTRRDLNMNIIDIMMRF